MHWEHEKINYVIVRRDDVMFQWVYSAKEFQETLNELCRGNTLQRVLTCLEGYLYSLRSDTNMLDLTYLGGPLLLVFRDFVLELIIHVEGQVEYRVLEFSQISFRKKFDYPPIAELSADLYFYDLEKQFALPYGETEVGQVRVEPTNCLGFHIEGFDDTLADLAAARCDLPGKILLDLHNGVTLSLICDSFEYSIIELFER